MNNELQFQFQKIGSLKILILMIAVHITSRQPDQNDCNVIFILYTAMNNKQKMTLIILMTVHSSTGNE